MTTVSAPAIAYLFNQYPRVAQAAMRREIEALDAMGLKVDRFTLRETDEPLVDPSDIAEKAKARVVLGVGAIGLASAMIRVFASSPGTFLKAFQATWRMARRSERGLLAHLAYLAEACVLRGWLAASGAAHVHCHYATNSAAVAMLCRVLGGPPYSFTMHGPEEFDSPRALSLGEKIHRAAFVVAICEFTRSQLYRWAAYEDWPKIRVVRCGVGPLFLDAGITPVPDVPRLVNVGRVAEQKGQMLLIRAAGMLRDEGIACDVTIVGDGPMRAEAERLIDALGLKDRVRITGYLSNRDVLERIRGSRALVLPSFAEGLPGVFFEAFALGRPVIATFIAGAPELVDESCGWIVPAGSIEALAEAMREALGTSPDLLGGMGREGARRVAERHDARVEAARLAELFATGGMMSAGNIDPPPRLATARAFVR
jgi:glycosyltransferase involved in cell wall biosynthesis